MHDEAVCAQELMAALETRLPAKLVSSIDTVVTNSPMTVAGAAFPARELANTVHDFADKLLKVGKRKRMHPCRVGFMC